MPPDTDPIKQISLNTPGVSAHMANVSTDIASLYPNTVYYNKPATKLDIHKDGLRSNIKELQRNFFDESNKARRLETLEAIERFEYKLENHKTVYPQYYV